MMSPHWFDHVFVALVALVFPVMDSFLIRRRVDRIFDGRPELRMGFYRKVIVEEWIVVLVLVVAWFALGRGPAELGLIPRAGLWAWLGYAVAALICLLLVIQTRSLIGNTAGLEAQRDAIGSLLILMPHDERERRAFDLVSLTAGVCEELLFRGFLTAYLMAAFGAPLWAAIVISSLAFGFAHLYQGPRGMLRVGVIGLIWGILYGLTGSLYAPMVAHAVMDMTSGRICLALASQQSPEDSHPGLAA
jgi:membrane protease YdiL (CAAX protease family)